MPSHSLICLFFNPYTGIGAHLAIRLANLGGQISLVDRNESGLTNVSEQIKIAGAPKPFIIVADVTTDAERIIGDTVRHFGKLDVLINNAGIVARNSVETIDLNEYDRIMNTNVRSIVQLSKLAVPHLEKTKGNILNVSSIAGLRIRPNTFAYSVSKAAVDQLTKSAALDLAPKGVRVNAINPGAIRTNILAANFGMTAEQTDEYLQNYKNRYPLGRAGECDDTTAAIEYLIGDRASFITGV